MDSQFELSNTEHKNELMLAWKLALLTAPAASKDDRWVGLGRDEFNNILETEGRRNGMFTESPCL